MFENLYAVTDSGCKTPAFVEKKNDRYTITVKKELIGAGASRIMFLEDTFIAEVDDCGYYVGNRDFERYTGFLTYFRQRTDFDYCTPYTVKLIDLFGVKVSKYSLIVVPVGMGYDACVHIYKKGNAYHIGLLYDIKRTNIYEDISVDVFLLDKDATYVDMAKRYRRYQLEDRQVLPLKKRIAQRPILKYIVDSVEIRIRQAWKKAPSDVVEQTAENEPPIKVAVTFERVMDIIDELKKQGVEKAEICLVGWNKSGHDGRWPTAFPVEPLLGGQEKLKKLIEYAQQNNYKIVCHTNSTDCYSISDYFKDGEISCKNRNKKPIINPFVWSGGRMYNLCPEKAWEIAQEILPKVADIGFKGAHYIDVLSIVEPRNCFDTNHPINTRQAVKYYYKIMELAQKLFGSFSSEGTFDYTAKYLDFGLYTSFDRKREECMDEGIPLWEIIFHGIVMANSAVNTVNYTIKTEKDRVQLIEKCSRPVFYFYSKFMSDGNHWMGQDDIICDTDEDLRRSVQKIKQACDCYAQYASLQMTFIDDFEKISEEASVTTYSDGSKIIANYGESAIEYDKIKVNANDCIIILASH